MKFIKTVPSFAALGFFAVITFSCASMKTVSDRKPAAASEVSYSRRALIFGSETKAGSMVMMHNQVGDAIDWTVDNAAYAWIYPWLKTRYTHVYYLAESSSEFKSEYENYLKEFRENQAKGSRSYPLYEYSYFRDVYVLKAWQHAIDNYDVIDYVTTVHSGGQFGHIPRGLKFKPGQLRLVYTTACNSYDSNVFVSQEGAAVAIGHRGISASPFFVYNFLRRWVVGESVSQAVRNSYNLVEQDMNVLGGVLALGGMWRSGKHVTQSTEPLISYTSEIDPEKFYVDSYIAPVRDTAEKRAIISKSAKELEADQKARCNAAKKWKTMANRSCRQDYWPGCDRNEYWSSCEVLE